MKIPHILTGLLTCGILSGCAHSRETTSSIQIPVSHTVGAGDYIVGAGNHTVGAGDYTTTNGAVTAGVDYQVITNATTTSEVHTVVIPLTNN